MKATKLYPFVPSGKNYKLAVSFFEELGFTKLWGDDDLCGLQMDEAYFMLQNYHSREWQENQMIVIEVDDLEAYWDQISDKDLESRFTGIKLKKPTDYPWGREIHIIDPAGVCWHIRNTED